MSYLSSGNRTEEVRGSTFEEHNEPEEWLKKGSEDEAVSAERGPPMTCEFCGTPTEIAYFACTYGPG